MALSFPRTFANLTTALLSYIDDNFNYIKTMFGAANGFATLDGSAKVVEEPASKAQASGVASLTAATLLAQNAPAGFLINSSMAHNSLNANTGIAKSAANADLTIAVNIGDILLVMAEYGLVIASGDAFFEMSPLSSVVAGEWNGAAGTKGYRQSAYLQRATLGANALHISTSNIFKATGAGNLVIGFESNKIDADSGGGAITITYQTSVIFMVKN